MLGQPGFDDVPLAAYTTPPLTTIRQDYATGARMLVERILQPRTSSTPLATVLPTELVVRASSLKEHHRQGRPHPGQKRRATTQNKPARTGLRD
jgi:hypothetical protein